METMVMETMLNDGDGDDGEGDGEEEGKGKETMMGSNEQDPRGDAK